MWSMKETNTLRHSLKLKLSQYSWYVSSYVIPGFEGYDIQVDVTKIDDSVKRHVPTFLKGTGVKLNLKNNHYYQDDE